MALTNIYKLFSHDLMLYLLLNLYLELILYFSFNIKLYIIYYHQIIWDQENLEV